MENIKTVSWANLTPAEATEQLDVVIGGQGGVGRKGLVPAPDPGAGDGTLVLQDNGLWGAKGGGGGGATKRSALFGDNIALVFTIPHLVAGGDLIPYVKKVSTGEKANCVTSNNGTNITITFVGTPPTANEFKVVWVG